MTAERAAGGGVGEKLRVLDLFCGAGGAAMGLHQAWPDAEIVGVDIKPQPKYPFSFSLCDVSQMVTPDYYKGSRVKWDFIWASPPCQAHTALKKMWNSKPHADLIPFTRAMLQCWGIPYVIENVPGAPLINPVRLCGTMFGLKTPCGAELRRHRYFECSFPVLAPSCFHGKSVIGVYGGHIRDRCRTITVTGSTPQQNVVRNRVRKTFTVNDARAAMGIDWMPMSALSQAIPPAYSKYIAEQWGRA